MFFSRCVALALAGVVTLAIGARAAAGVSPFFLGTAPPPPPPEVDNGSFDVPRKPPIPVSFLSNDGGWIQFQYPPSARDRVASVIAQADELRAELTEALGQTPLEGVEVRIARGTEEMSTLAPSGSAPDPQQTSVVYPQLRLIVLSLGTGDPSDLASSFGLELARLALWEAVGGRTLPHWFSEGFAARFSREGEWEREWQLYRAALGHRLHSTAELDRAFEKGATQKALAHAEATDFFIFLLNRGEKTARFAAAIERLRQGDEPGSALGAGYGSDIAVLERQWRSDVSRKATLTTIVVGVGVPALGLLGYGLIRATRRRRSMAIRTKGRKERRRGAIDTQRVHIVLSRREDRAEPPVLAPEAEVPKVEHEGEWHTLH
jgi:hypothetical protein